MPGRDEAPHAVGEDLGAAAGQRAEAGVAQLAQHLLVREAGERRHVVDLARREELQVHVGHRLVQLPDDLDVVVEVDVRALAADHVDLGEAGQLALAERVLDELLRGVRVRALLLLRDGEGAELALHAADVRLVQIQVLDEVDLVAAAALPAREVGQLAEPEDVVGLHQREPVLEVEPLARLDLLADRLERRGAVEDGHYAVLSTTASVIASSSSRAATPSRHDPRLLRVLAGDLVRLLDRAAGGDAQHRAVERAAGQRAADDLVLARGQQERQRRDSLTEVGAGDLPRLDGLARAVEAVVDDLERDAEREAERAELGDGRFRAGRPPRRASPSSACSARGTPRRWSRGAAAASRSSASPRTSASAASARIATASPVAGRSELGEGAGEEVDAAGSRGIRAVLRPDRCAASPQLRAVDQVVVDEARHVHELDRDAGRDRVGSSSGSAVRKTRSGRRRFPPEASASAPISATRPGRAVTAAASRSSSSSR